MARAERTPRNRDPARVTTRARHATLAPPGNPGPKRAFHGRAVPSAAYLEHTKTHDRKAYPHHVRESRQRPDALHWADRFSPGPHPSTAVELPGVDRHAVVDPLGTVDLRENH